LTHFVEDEMAKLKKTRNLKIKTETKQQLAFI